MRRDSSKEAAHKMTVETTDAPMGSGLTFECSRLSGSAGLLAGPYLFCAPVVLWLVRLLIMYIYCHGQPCP